MKTKRMKWMQHMIVFVLVIAMLLPMAAPVSVQAAENELYLAYQEDENGTPITKLDKSSRKMYKVDELSMNVGENVDLCFINAAFWVNPQWRSSDNSVIKVDKAGVVTAIAPGTAQVTFTYSKLWGEKVSASVVVYVSEKNSVTDKMNKLFAIVGNKYFTTTQKPCKESRERLHPEDECEKCKVSNIVKATWFEEAFKDFGPVNYNNFPRQHFSKSGTNINGYSCYGFTLFAQYYVFAKDSTQKIVLEVPKFGNFTKTFVKENIQPGDVIRFNETHSVLVYSVEDDGIMVIDCNGNRNKLNCLVEKRKFKYTGDYAGSSIIVDRVAISTEELTTSTPTPSTSEKKQYGYYHYTDGNGDYAVCAHYGQETSNWKNIYREEIWVDEPLKLVSKSATSYKHPEVSGCKTAGCLEGDFWDAGGKFVDENGISWYREQTRMESASTGETQNRIVIKETSTVSGNGNIADSVLQARMEELVSELLKANKKAPGNSNATEAYFTTTGKIYKADSGDTCKNTKVVKETWFTEVFGNVNVDNFPKHLQSRGNGDSNIGYSCFGFACFAQWYIYKNSNNDKVTAKQVASGEYTKEFLTNNLQTGDIIRIYISKNGSTYYHSMVFHSFTENGMIVLDCNRNTDNKVRLNEIKYSRDGWSGDPVWIYRVQE